MVKTKIEPKDTPQLTNDQILQLFLNLGKYESVTITREEDEDWVVSLYENKRDVCKESPWLYKALWAACEEIDKLKEQDYTEYEQKRTAALSKLNAEDRKILGI